MVKLREDDVATGGAWPIIGHTWAVALLQRAIATQHLVHAYLFSGPASIGKRTLARTFAAALLCTADTPPCGACRACMQIARGSYPDLTWIEPEEGRIKIGQVRAARRELALSPFAGRWRVCVLAEAQTATTEAANALLKTLEEPPARVILLLTALDASLLLPTIVSRCQVVPLRAVGPAEIARALTTRWGVEEERAAWLARLAGGRIGWAIRAAEDPAVLVGRQRALEELRALLALGRAGRIQAAERLADQKGLPARLQLWQTWWRDVALLQSGCEELVMHRDALDALRQCAEVCDLAGAEALVRGLEAALEQLEQNVNPRLALEVLLLSWPLVA